MTCDVVGWGAPETVTCDAPTDRRRQPHGTIGVLYIADGELLKTAIVEVT